MSPKTLTDAWQAHSAARDGLLQTSKAIRELVALEHDTRGTLPADVQVRGLILGAWYAARSKYLASFAELDKHVARSSLVSE